MFVCYLTRGGHKPEAAVYIIEFCEIWEKYKYQKFFYSSKEIHLEVNQSSIYIYIWKWK
jgi:hypothetical protein